MAHSRRRKFLEIMKLAFLEEQEEQLSSLVHEKIDKYKSWLYNNNEESTGCSFREMNQMIEETVEFVTTTITQIEENSHEFSPQESSLESRAKAAVASCDSSLLPVDNSELTSLEPRMKKMEEAVRAIIDNLEMLMTRQTNIENGMGDLSVKHSKRGDKWMKQFNQVDSKMIDLRQREDDFVQQHDREIQSLKEELDELKKSRAAGSDCKETLQATLDSLQQDMGNVQGDVQKLRDAIQAQGHAMQANKDVALKLREITEELSSLKPKIQCQESMCARPVVGFTARLRNGYRPTKSGCLQWDRDVKCNTDKSFNVDTGIFTAPVKGMYFVCLRLRQFNDGSIALNVLQTHKSQISSKQTELEHLCLAHTARAKNSDTVFVLTEMNVGDAIHVKVDRVSENVILGNGTKFTCFLVK